MQSMQSGGFFFACLFLFCFFWGGGRGCSNLTENVRKQSLGTVGRNITVALYGFGFHQASGFSKDCWHTATTLRWSGCLTENSDWITHPARQKILGVGERTCGSVSCISFNLSFPFSTEILSFTMNAFSCTCEQTVFFFFSFFCDSFYSESILNKHPSCLFEAFHGYFF